MIQVKLTIIDIVEEDLYTTDNDFPKCPACNYRSSYFLTAGDRPSDEYFKEDKLDELDQPPLCHSCYMDIFKDNVDKICYTFTR